MTKKPAHKPRDPKEAEVPLTGLQLRAARRMAQKHGLTAVSDADAVRQLKSRGIDPFARTAQLKLATSNGQAITGADAPAVTPAVIETKPAMTPAEARAAEIAQIQKDMARTRRKRLRALLVRLFLFVTLPGVFAGVYFSQIATPLFATSSEFLIIKNDGGGGTGLLSGTQFATNQDAIAVQSFLLSKEAMLRLDDDVGFRVHFSQPGLDPLTQLPEGASIEMAHRLYRKMVRIGFDPSEGVLRMEVRATDAETAARYAAALIGYAEARVDQLSQRKRDTALAEAEQGLAEATSARQAAQRRLIELQQNAALADPEGRILSLRGQINGIEVQLQDKRLRLAALQANLRAPAARITAAEGEVARLESMLADLNAQMTSATDGAQSLAAVAVAAQVAQADLATRDVMLQAAIDRLDNARREADAQARYLSVSVAPIAPQDAAYPRVWKDTALAFLIAAGVYLMVSLTVSILREQVTN